MRTEDKIEVANGVMVVIGIAMLATGVGLRFGGWAALIVVGVFGILRGIANKLRLLKPPEDKA
jgi:hypothetical protein